jgi:zinc transport system ATP-binding protein
MSLISVKDVGIRYGAHTALEHVSLTINPNEIVTVVGPNGSGKTSLLRAIVGAIPLSSGTVEIKPELRIGYVPQRLHVDPTLPITVARFLHLPRRIDRTAVQAAMERAGVPDIADRQMSQLSGGQLQRVLLARALANSPDLLLLDEPTQGLDQPASAAFYHLIEDVRRETGCSILMISHELHVVMAASDRVICLNGHVCCQGTPEVVSSAPEYRALFGRGTGGALALYRHDHDHVHDETCDHSHPPREAAE